MKKTVIYTFWLLCVVFSYACQQRMICPAYHSYFILDVEETKKHFSYYGLDSLPKEKWNIEIDKKKVGIADELPYHKKVDAMRTVSMESIYKKLEEEDLFKRELATYAESDTVPVMVDTIAILAKEEEQDFENIDQMIYLHHFGKYLPKRGDDLDQMADDMEGADALSDEETESMIEEPAKKGFWPFGKKKKKKKEELADEESGDGDMEEDDGYNFAPRNYNYDDDDEEEESVEEEDAPKKKKKEKKVKKEKKKKDKKKKDSEEDEFDFGDDFGDDF